MAKKQNTKVKDKDKVKVKEPKSASPKGQAGKKKASTTSAGDEAHLAMTEAERALRRAEAALTDATARLERLLSAADTQPRASASRTSTPPAQPGATPSVVELRKQASAKGVVGYSRLSKAALIEALSR